MTDPVKVELSSDQMFSIRTRALELAIQSIGGSATGTPSSAGLTLHTAGSYLNFLLNGMPTDQVPGGIAGPFPNTPDVIAGAQAVPADAPKAGRKPKLAAVSTSVSVATSPSVAPVQAALQVQTAAIASGPASMVSTPTQSAAGSLIPPPANVQDAAISLKALVQDDVRGAAAGYENPGSGRKAAVALLAQYGVTQLGQIPPTKLSEFKAKLDATGNQAAPNQAIAGSDLL